jgi:2'-5' RNA ligase
VKRDNLHQTLVFLGNVAAEGVTGVAASVANLGIAAFELEFGTIGYWRHNRIAWAAPYETPEPLQRLVSALRRGLQEAGLRMEERPYASHVTLLRDARAPAALPVLALHWPVNDFALVESARGKQGPAYRVLTRWELRAGPPRPAA